MDTAVIFGVVGALVALSIVGIGLMALRGEFEPKPPTRELMERLTARFGSEEKDRDRTATLAPRVVALKQRRLGVDQAV